MRDIRCRNWHLLAGMSMGILIEMGINLYLRTHYNKVVKLVDIDFSDI